LIITHPVRVQSIQVTEFITCIIVLHAYPHNTAAAETGAYTMSATCGFMHLCCVIVVGYICTIYLIAQIYIYTTYNNTSEYSKVVCVYTLIYVY
jgi:hypothetical protein